MHLQVKMSPDETRENFRRVVDALADQGINIEAIAPDFDPPHVRVLVKHIDPYDPDNAQDPLNLALAALTDAGLTPELKAGLLLRMPNKPRALKIALDRCGETYAVESVLVLPGGPSANVAWVSCGVARPTLDGWEAEADEMKERIEAELADLPDS